MRRTDGPPGTIRPLLAFLVFLTGCESDSVAFLEWPEVSFSVAFVTALDGDILSIVGGPLRIEDGEITRGEEELRFEADRGRPMLIGFTEAALLELHPRASLDEVEAFVLQKGTESCQEGRLLNRDLATLPAALAEIVSLDGSAAPSELALETSYSLIAPLDPTPCTRKRLEYESLGPEPQLLQPGTVLDDHPVDPSNGDDLWNYYEVGAIFASDRFVYLHTQVNIFAVEPGTFITSATPRTERGTLAGALGLDTLWYLKRIAPVPQSDGRVLLAIGDAQTTTAIAEGLLEDDGRVTAVRTATIVPFEVNRLAVDSAGRFVGVGGGPDIVAGVLDGAIAIVGLSEDIERVFSTTSEQAPFLLTSAGGGVLWTHWPVSSGDLQRTTILGGDSLTTAVVGAGVRSTPQGPEVWIATHTEGVFVSTPGEAEWKKPRLYMSEDESICAKADSTDACGFFEPNNPSRVIQPFTGGGLSFSARGCASMIEVDPALRCAMLDPFPDPIVFRQAGIGAGAAMGDGVVVSGGELFVAIGRPAE